MAGNGKANSSPLQLSVLPSPQQVTISLLGLYCLSTSSSQTTENYLQSFRDQVDAANFVLANSQIPVTLAVNSFCLVNYNESDDISVDLPAVINPADGYMDNAAQLRDRAGPISSS